MKIKIIVLLLLAGTMLGGCKSKTINEEFDKHHAKPNELLFTKQIEEKTVGFYKAQFENANDGIGVAVFEGSHEAGWNEVDAYAFSSPSEVIIEAGRLHLKNNDNVRLLHGTIDSPDIAKIEVTDKDGKVIEAAITNTNWKRVWYAAADIVEMKVRAYTADGKIAVEVPYRN